MVTGGDKLMMLPDSLPLATKAKSQNSFAAPPSADAPVGSTKPSRSMSPVSCVRKEPQMFT